METTTTKNKRVFLQLEVTPEQKEKYKNIAIKKYGKTLSAWAIERLERPEPNESFISEFVGFDQEDLNKALEAIQERDALIKDKDTRIKELESIVESKSMDGLKKVTSSDFLIELSPKKREIIDLSIKNEANRFFGNEYKDLNHLIYKSIGDIVGSNTDELPDEYFAKGSPENTELKELIAKLKDGSEG